MGKKFVAFAFAQPKHPVQSCFFGLQQHSDRVGTLEIDIIADIIPGKDKKQDIKVDIFVGKIMIEYQNEVLKNLC